MIGEQLPPDVTPDSSLEDRVVETLAREQLLKRSRPSAASRGWQLAAAAVLFAAGAVAGTAWHRASQPVVTQPRYLLLLHGASTASAADERNAVAAYRAWATRLAGEGRYVTGERLSAESRVVPPGGSATDPVQGYFIVSAASLGDAIAVAETAPHVARGGHIVVRPIDTP